MSDGTTQNMTGTRRGARSSPPLSVSAGRTRNCPAGWLGDHPRPKQQPVGIGESHRNTTDGRELLSLIDSVNPALTARIGDQSGLTAGNSSAGSLCAMVYVSTESGNERVLWMRDLRQCLLTLSLLNDLTANTLTGNAPRRDKSSRASTPGPINNATPLRHLQRSRRGMGNERSESSTGASPITEEEFSLVPLYGAKRPSWRTCAATFSNWAAAAASVLRNGGDAPR